MKATRGNEIWCQANAQISSPSRAKCPQLPKLRARTSSSRIRRQNLLRSTTQAGNVAEAGGGATRHTRVWSVGPPTVVADCRRLRFVPLSCQMQRSATVNKGVWRSSCWASHRS